MPQYFVYYTVLNCTITFPSSQLYRGIRIFFFFFFTGRKGGVLLPPRFYDRTEADAVSSLLSSQHFFYPLSCSIFLLPPFSRFIKSEEERKGWRERIPFFRRKKTKSPPAASKGPFLPHWLLLGRSVQSCLFFLSLPPHPRLGTPFPFHLLFTGTDSAVGWFAFFVHLLATQRSIGMKK